MKVTLGLGLLCAVRSNAQATVANRVVGVPPHGELLLGGDDAGKKGKGTAAKKKRWEYDTQGSQVITDLSTD